MSEVEITTDGSCLGNPGPGGWACILRCGQHERVLQGGVADTTNNRMELTAAIEGLRVEACQSGHRADGLRVCTPGNHRVPSEAEGQRLASLHWKASGESGFVGGTRGVGRLPRGDLDTRPRTLRATESRTV